MKKANGKLIKDIRLNKSLYQKPYTPIFFTMITNYKKPYFIQSDLNKQIIKHLKEIFQTSTIILPVYCLMPDHLHFIIYPSKQDENLMDKVNYFAIIPSSTQKY